MDCIRCGAKAVVERPNRTRARLPALSLPRLRQTVQRTRWHPAEPAQYPSDVIALVVLWRLRYRLSLRDLPELFLIRGIGFSNEAVRDWEAKLTPALAETLRRRRTSRHLNNRLE